MMLYSSAASARVAAQVQDPPRVVEAAAHRVPPRRVGQEVHADQQGDRRYRGDGQHDPPHVRVLDDLVEDRVDDESQHLTRHDHELVDRDHSAAPFGGCHLGQVERDRRGRGTDAEPEDDAGDHHDRGVRRDRAQQGADQEQDTADEQRALAAEPVRQPAAQQRAEGGAGEQQHRHDGRLGGGGQVQVVLHVQQRTGDDTGVVTEQQAAEGGDDRELGQIALAGTRPRVVGGTGWPTSRSTSFS
jgi:hypothetical protein